jgi:alpha-N-arabinofuranosidase
MVLNFDKAELRINKDVYGHIAEYLECCVYEGIRVGPDYYLDLIRFAH